MRVSFGFGAESLLLPKNAEEMSAASCVLLLLPPDDIDGFMIRFFS